MINLRLRYGMFWKGKYPPVPWKEIGIVALCAAAYGLVAYVDDLQERVLQMEANTALRKSYFKTITACMEQAENGGTASFIIGKEMFDMDCTKLSGDAYGGLRR